MHDILLKFIDEIENEKHYSELTVSGYLTDLSLFIEYLNQNNINKFNDVEYNDIRLYINYLYDLKYKNTTISRHISALKSSISELLINFSAIGRALFSSLPIKSLISASIFSITRL